MSRDPAVAETATATGWLRMRSFDGGVELDVRASLPDSYRSFAGRREDAGPMIARGQGLSYAGASFGRGSTSIVMAVFDRILDFDAASGDVVVEAGITLAALFDFLLARGRYLTVQPGHDQISVGGCIAANVHGKNQARDGTFVDQVQQMTLYHPAHGVIEVERGTADHLFDITCGGFGLTGIILTARLKTVALPGRAMSVTVARICAADAAGALKAAADGGVDLVYSWHDLAGSGYDLVVSGRFIDRGVPEPRRGAHALSAEWRAATVLQLQTRATGRIVNLLYRALTPPGEKAEALRAAFFPSRGKEAYFRLFGRRGFHEYQSVVPLGRLPEYLERAKALALQHRVPIVLASGKHFDGVPSLLRFTGAGTCFAVNVPRSPNAAAFMDGMDRLAIELGCRPNIIKDSRLPLDVVAATYGEYDRFRRCLHAWDPKRVFRSELSERLGL